MDLLELSRRLKPIVLGWLEDGALGVVPGPHALDPAAGPHTGTLPLAGVGQSGAASGEAPVWDGAAWTPTDVGTLLGGTPALVFGVTNAPGVATTFVRTDDSLAIFDATVPTTIQPDDAAAAGVAAFAARRDHAHAISAAAPGGILSVTSINSEGVGSDFARADHLHQIQSSSSPGVNQYLLASNVAGGLTLTGLLTLNIGGLSVLNGANITMANGSRIGIGGGSTDERIVFDATNQYLQLLVSGGGIVIEGDATSPSIRSGYSGNSIGSGVQGGVICGGGVSGAVNSVTGDYGAILGGYDHAVTGDLGVILGGRDCSAGVSALAAGIRAKATHQGAFVLADSQNADFASTTTDELALRFQNGYRFTGGNVAIGVSAASEKLVVGVDFGVLSGDRISVGAVGAWSGYNLGEDVDNRGWMLWINSGPYIAFGTRESGTNYGNTLVLKSGRVGMNGILSPSTELDIGAGAIEFAEMTAPTAGVTNTGRLFLRDNGSGKSQLCVRFNTGAIQVIATEP